MPSKVVNINVIPRSPFREFIQTKKRWLTLVVHRRAGKTVAAVQRIIICAITHKRKGMKTAPLRYAYIAPTRDQAKDIAWQYFKDFTAGIPGVVVNESELKITLPNGAQIRLYSGENYERMRGLYFDGVVSDEDDDIPPGAFTFVILPCLIDYDGWHCRTGTPKGKASLYKAINKGRKNDKYFTLLLKASESGLIAKESLDAIREEIGEDAYAQEMECDFNVARPGAIYATEITEARKRNRIHDFEVDDAHLVHTTWDLGNPENTVCIYWQKVGLTYRVIDCDFDLRLKTGERVAHMLNKGYSYGQHMLPHDGKTRGSDNMNFQGKLREAGLKNVEILDNAGFNAEDRRIRSMHDLFSQIHFRAETVDVEGGLIEALENYHNKEEKSSGKTTNVVVHDWCSHFADAFGYFGEAILAGRLRDSLSNRGVGRARASFGNSTRR